MSAEIKRAGRVKKLIWNIITSGLRADHDLEVLRKIVLKNLLLLVGFVTLPILCIVVYSEKHYILFIIDSAFFLFLVAIFFYLRKSKNHDSAAVIGTMAMGVLFFFFVVYAGVYNKTYYIWAFLYPLLSLFLLGTVRGSFFSLLLLGIVCTLFIVARHMAFMPSYDIEKEIRFGAVYITIYLIAFVMEKVRQAIQDRLNISKSKLEKTIAEKEHLIQKLQKTIDEVTVLRGILPICSHCKKIWDDKGYRHQVESYFSTHSEAGFTHGICPECMKELYPYVKIPGKNQEECECLSTDEAV
ncbi:MAG: hypothetical protein JXC33_02940 [Deltaproteobacteria bacterium]|nr:hypothetical protein [Deltaproteobacteria bacterium]